MATNMSIKRLTTELKQMTKEPIEGMTFEHPADLYTWNIAINGPKDTPYENGVFKILLRMDDTYPFKPPSVKFLSPIFHPNIYSDGKICIDILQSSEWSAALNIRTVLLSIISLINDPNPLSPANRKAAELYVKDRNAYNEQVKKIFFNIV